MKVALAIDTLPPYTSGVTTHYVVLAEKLLQKGHDILILTPRLVRKPKLPESLKKAKIVYLPSFPVRHAKGLKLAFPSTPRTLYELRKFNPDIIESSSPSSLGVDTLLSSKLLKKPCVSYFYTLFNSREYIYLITERFTKLAEAIVTKYTRWFYKRVDKVFVPTPKVKSIVLKLGIPKTKISIAPVFTDIKVSEKPDKEHINYVKNKYKLKKNVAVYLGRLSIEKNLDMLLKVWLKVVNKNKGATLLIIGDGNYRPRVQHLINLNKLGNNVILTGNMTHKEILKTKILSACDLYISTSTSETFGLAGLEAMSHGLPVVLADSTGLSEIAQGAGFICNPKDINSFVNAVITIFSDNELKKKLSKKAIRISKSFDSNMGIEKIIKLYSLVINNYNMTN